LQLEEEGVGSVSNQRRVERVIAGGQSRIKVVDEFSYLVFHVLSPQGSTLYMSWSSVERGSGSSMVKLWIWLSHYQEVLFVIIFES
jgi:hypothetical protein